MINFNFLLGKQCLWDLREYMVKFEELNLEKEIGKGSFGAVFKGYFKNEVVAIKTIIITEDVDKFDTLKNFRKEVFVSRFDFYSCRCFSPFLLFSNRFDVK